jgi:hypothetical protein
MESCILYGGQVEYFTLSQTLVAVRSSSHNWVSFLEFHEVIYFVHLRVEWLYIAAIKLKCRVEVTTP